MPPLPRICIRRFTTLLSKPEKTGSRGGLPIHTPSSLDPSRLNPSDYWDFSLHKTPCRPQNVSRDLAPAKLVYPLRQAFPDGTRGFLYYHRPPSHLPQTAGQVRLRLIQEQAEDPTTLFAKSTDLLGPTGLPWSIPYWKLTGNSPDAEMLAPIRESLLSSALIDKDTLIVARGMFEEGLIRDIMAGHTYLLHNMDDVFCMRFGTRRKLKLWLVNPTGDGLTSVSVNTHDIELPDSLRKTITEPEHVKRLWAHVQIEYDPAKYRFATRVVAAYDATEKMMHTAFGELEPIQSLKTESPPRMDPYEALLSFISHRERRQLQLTEKQRSYERISKHYVTTLHPASLQVSDFQDLSGYTRRKLLLNDDHQSIVRYSYVEADGHIPFPPNTRGYFYYYAYPWSSGYPPSANEVRFRRVRDSTTNPYEDWKSGTDLLQVDGLPWSVRFHEIALAPGMETVRQLLMKDGLVTLDQLERYREVVSATSLTDRRMFTVSFGVGYPFPIRFHLKSSKIWLVTPNEMQQLSIKTDFLQPFTKPHTEGLRGSYINSALVCLEANEQGVYVRILKVPPAFGAKMKYKVGQKVRLGYNESKNSPAIQLLSRMVGRAIEYSPSKKK